MKKALFLFCALTALPALTPAQDLVPVDPGLRKVVQVAIVCRDIEASAQRWSKILGMPVPPISTTRPGHEVKVMYKGKPSEGQAKLTFFNLGQVVLELLQPVGKDTSWKKYLDKHGEGVQHLGFQVVDPGKAVAAFDAMGMPVLHRGRYDKDNGDYIYIDTEKALAVTVELLHSDAKK